MRIGIVTHPPRYNYGGILQAYALQVILKRMGHVPELFMKKHYRKLTWWLAPAKYFKRAVNKYLFRKRKARICYEKYFNEVFDPIVEQNTRKFVTEHMSVRRIDSFRDIKPYDYDAIIVGSDQIWRPSMLSFLKPRSVQTAFLEFAKRWKIKRIAYATSFGVDEWEFTLKQTIDCRRLVRLFDAISVRERAGVALCKEYLKTNAVHVLDPTMLLDSTDYISLFESKQNVPTQGNMLCYILDTTPDKSLLIDRIAVEKGLTPFAMSSSLNYREEPENQVQPPVEQWLRAFYDSEYIITDSFHACAFSIIFRRQFVVYGNQMRGMDRFNSLLTLFGLEDRLITNSSQYHPLQPIDYSKIEPKLKDMQQFSINFLANNLL